MSPGSKAERIGVLRDRIARIEAAATPVAARSAGRLSEIVPAGPGDGAAASGFALAMAGAVASGGTIVWVAEDFALREGGIPYGLGLAAFGVDPSQFVLVRAAGARQALWALEEALKSPACAVAVGEIWQSARHCDLAATRRLLLAARAGGTMGLLVHMTSPGGELSTAAQERLEIRALPGRTTVSAGGRRPIPGAPVWGLRLLKAAAAAGRAHLSDPEAVREIVWDRREGLAGDTLSLRMDRRQAHA